MTSKRTRVVGLAATLASIPLLLPAVAHADGANGWTDSSADPNSYPPLPGECAGGQQWWQWVGDPAALPLASSSPYIVLPMNVPAGVVSVPEAITWDSRAASQDEQPVVPNLDRLAVDTIESESSPYVELNESMRVEFYKDDTFLGATPYFTPDLADDNPYAWSVSDLGSVTLAQDANQVVLAHSSTFMDTDGTDNWFLPKSICVTSTPVEIPTTTTVVENVGPKPAASLAYDCSNATITMTNTGDESGEVSYGVGDEWTTVTVEAGATVTQTVPLTEDESTYLEAWAGDQQAFAEVVAPNCVAETQVLAETETAELAFTGSDTTRNTGIGAALLAAGLAMIGFSSRRRKLEA